MAGMKVYVMRRNSSLRELLEVSRLERRRCLSVPR